ncbi:Xenotropic and polytropic retrovirus receptor 1 [Geranomyces variabilis]|nr:Xenotropic and polytropic retrovirus receptor 1 [Geranomyces variabilis]
MKFAKYLAENSVPEWRSRYVNYRGLKKLVKQATAAKSSALSSGSDSQGSLEGSCEALTSPPSAVAPNLHTRTSTVESGLHLQDDAEFLLALEEVQLGREEVAFFTKLDYEMRKADKFYKMKESDAARRLKDLHRQCDIMMQKEVAGHEQAPRRTFLGADHEGRQERFIIEDEEIVIPESASDAEHFTPLVKNPKHRLQKAFLEYYRLLELLKNFRIINQTSLTKILKKNEKNTGTQGDWYLARAKRLHLFVSNTIDELISQTETLFTKVFADGNRQHAMRSLRIPDVKAQDSGVVSWRTGFLLGLSVPAILLTLRKVFHDGFPDPNVTLILLVYGGLSIPILFLFLYALLLVIWARFHVNWVLVFELDPRDYLPPGGFSEFASVLFFLFSYTLYLALDDNFLSFISLKWYPTILLVVILIIVLNPLDIFYRSSRTWFIRSAARIVFSGFFPVQFRDFFITDLLSSMTYMFVSLPVLVCSAVYDLDNLEAHCGFSKSWTVPAITAIPACWRLAQCLRRYHDAPLRHPHLNNALKYCLSLSVIFLSATAKITESSVARGFWILFAILASCYAYFWDVWFDWGLFQRQNKNKYLRKVIVYPKWVYGTAICTNFVLRLSWVFLLSPNNWGLFNDARLLVYLQALMELWRRFIWCIIRMENEHTNNIGNFRAVTEVPLPFRVKIIPLTEDAFANRKKPRSGSRSGLSILVHRDPDPPQEEDEDDMDEDDIVGAERQFRPASVVKN